VADEYTTKPTLETLLGKMTAFGERMEKRIDGLEERMFIRLDRIESEVKKTRSEFYDLRADFRELRSRLREHIPALKA
jgi:hypothetical protein